MPSPASPADAVAGDRQLSDQGIERRSQIVEAATRLFAERGYAATRIADICEQAGVAKGLFYWYFDTKLDVFIEVARTMQQRLRKAQAAAFRPDADPLARIAAGTAASVTFMTEHASYFALINVERTDPAIRAALRSIGSVYLDDVVALIREAQMNGSIPDRDPVLLGIGVLGAVSSFTNASRSGTVDTRVADLADFAADWVVHALTADPR